VLPESCKSAISKITVGVTVTLYPADLIKKANYILYKAKHCEKKQSVRVRIGNFLPFMAAASKFQEIAIAQ